MSICQMWILGEYDEWQCEITAVVCVVKNFRNKNHTIRLLELQVCVLL